MIASQRKAHKVIWLLLTVSMVIFLILSIRELDFSTSTKTISKDAVVASLNGDKVMITINTPLKSASSVVYELTGNGETGRILGQINTVGTYTFKVAGGTKGIIIVDKIKDNQLFKTTF